MDYCPICGKEITLLPYFDVREPALKKCAALHIDSNTNCPIGSAPPR